MPSKRKQPQPALSPVDEQLRKEERGRRIVAKVRASKKFMAGVRESLEARRRGEPSVRFEDLKRKDA